LPQTSTPVKYCATNTPATPHPSPSIATPLSVYDAGTGALSTLGVALTENAIQNLRLWHIFLSNVLESPRKERKNRGCAALRFSGFPGIAGP
jgi:hypothetical protein